LVVTKANNVQKNLNNHRDDYPGCHGKCYFDKDYFELTDIWTVRLGIMSGMYCIEPLRRIYRSTWLGGQVASPRDKEGYPGITINPKLTIFGVA